MFRQWLLVVGFSQELRQKEEAARKPGIVEGRVSSCTGSGSRTYLLGFSIAEEIRVIFQSCCQLQENLTSAASLSKVLGLLDITFVSSDMRPVSQARAMNICRASIFIAAILWALESTSLAMSLRGASALKLHLYDHCPYCTRVELVLGWHGRRYERAVYGYADVKGPTALTGKKVLPVITWRDEDGMEHTLGESLDIIEAASKLAGAPRITQLMG